MTKSIKEQLKRSLSFIECSCCNVQALDLYQPSNLCTICFVNKLQKENAQFLAVVKELREALKHTNEFCLCKRNTYGFDYHEDHPVMGKPKSGRRWLTPRDFNKDTLTKADQMLKEMGI